MKRYLSYFLLFFILFLPLKPVFAFTEESKYVRTANYYLKAGTDIPQKDYVQLAKYDLLILPAEAQVYNKDLFPYLRKSNPDIIILAYIPSMSINSAWQDSLHQDLTKGIEESWWLRDSLGNIVSIWPGTKALNITSEWKNYLARFVHNKVMTAHLWDGIFYDEVHSMISFANGGDIDLDNNREKDEKEKSDQAWREGMTALFRYTRQLEGDNVIIIGNGSSREEYQPYLNGRLFESFPTPWENNGNWAGLMKNYDQLFKKVKPPALLVINSNTNNGGNKADYKKMRFGLTSALLNDGFFSFDYGDKDHGQLWWYDEFDAYLGKPAGNAFNRLNGNQAWKEGLWQRNYKNGAILVNSTNQRQKILFNEEFEKIHGSQDSAHNDGSITSALSIDPQDGIILLRPVEKITGNVFTNGSFARVFDGLGKVKRTGFFAYKSEYRGSSNIIVKDINQDGLEETIVADTNKVEIYSGGKKIASFFPYGEKHRGGINMSAGDLDNNGSVEIVTGTEKGGSQIRIFDHQGKLINPGFFAFGKDFKGGVNISIGDLDGDLKKEIIVGAGYGGGPQVRVFNLKGKLINPGFFAYDKKFRGGVNVAVGDINGDRVDEIITGPGLGGGPQVRVFNRKGQLLSSGFFAYDSRQREGVKVIANDLDGDGKDEILALTTDVFTITMY